MVIIVQYLRQHFLIRRMTESFWRCPYPFFCILFIGQVGQDIELCLCFIWHIAHCSQIGFRDIFPAIGVFFANTSTAFAKPCIANFIFVHQHLPLGLLDSFRNIFVGYGCDALITLTMVVRTHVKECVVFTIIPSNDFIFLFDEREKSCGCLFKMLTLFYLCQEPTTGNDRMRLQQFQRRSGFHLAGDNTLQITLYGNVIDGEDFSALHNKSEGAIKSLRLFAFPVKIHANSHIVEGKCSLLGLWYKGEFSIVIIFPLNGAIHQLYLLLSINHLSFCQKVLVQRKQDCLGTHYSHRHFRFSLIDNTF